MSREGAWIVGVDGGGSRGRALFGRALFGRAEAVEGPHPEPALGSGSAEHDASCNPYAVGAEAAGRAILAVIAAAQRAAGAPADALAEAFVCIGTAGVERPLERSQLTAQLIAGGIAPERLRLEGDPWVALEGALPDDGTDLGARLMLVAGTGSVAVGVGSDGVRQRVGGWGSRVGDEGGGAWLGIEAVRATLCALDGRTSVGALATAVGAAWGDGPEPLVARARDASPADFAQLAPLVLHHREDPVAEALRAQAVDHLCALVVAVARRVEAASGPSSVALATTGGIASALEGDLRARLPAALAAAWRPASAAPVVGAWRLAREQARSLAR